MMKKKNKGFIARGFAAFVLLLIVALSITAVYSVITNARLNYAATFSQHVGAMNCVDWGTQDLSGEATAAITSRCTYVESCVGTISSNAATQAADLVVCNVPTQSGSNLGKAVINADYVGGDASGSITVNYIITGYGSK